MENKNIKSVNVHRSYRQTHERVCVCVCVCVCVPDTDAQLGINSICFLLLVPSSFWTVGLHSLVNVCVCGGGGCVCACVWVGPHCV